MDRSNRLDIVYVGILRPSISGDAVSGTDLINILTQRGHSIRAIEPRARASIDECGVDGDGLHPGVSIERLKSEVVRLYYPPCWPTYFASRAEVTSVLLRLVNADRPDVILVGSPRCAAGISHLASRVGIPWLCCVRGELGIADMMGFDPRVHDRALSEVIQADHAVSCAEHQSEWLVKKGVTRITTIPNGIDLGRFSPAPKDPALLWRLELDPEHVVIGHISRLDEFKRPGDIIRSAADVVRCEPRIRYVIVGEQTMIPMLREECERRGIVEEVRFVEQQDYSRIPDFVRVADVMVIPSTVECMCRVYLETQACGRVLLASDIPAAREVVEDGKTGVLFRTGDIDDLTSKTVRLAEDAGRRRSIGLAARAYAESNHDIQSVASGFERILGDIVGTRKGIVEKSQAG